MKILNGILIFVLSSFSIAALADDLKITVRSECPYSNSKVTVQLSANQPDACESHYKKTKWVGVNKSQTFSHLKENCLYEVSSPTFSNVCYLAASDGQDGGSDVTILPNNNGKDCFCQNINN